MNNIESKTDRQIQTHCSNPDNKFVSKARQTAGKFIPAIFMVVIFLVSTSYHSRYEEIQLIEKQYFLPELRVALAETLNRQEEDFLISLEGTDLMMTGLIHQFYILQDFNPSFTTYNDLNSQGSLVLDLLGNANYYGLEPAVYHTDMIKDLQLQLQDQDLKQMHVKIRKDIELLMADAVLKFMSNLHSGYRMTDSAFFADPFVCALPSSLRDALSGNDLFSSVLSCQPEFIEYARLQRATENYVQRVELTENWVDIYGIKEDSMLLWQGIHEVLQRLGYILRDTGYSALSEALKTFQQYHGLEQDGKPGMNTIEALNQSSMYTYRTLALNLDRLRKQEYNTAHALFVNIPAYSLKVIKENSVQQVYRVCVGRTYSPTPLIDGNIEQIITNPEWNVPRRIARNEILPKIKNDADYLKRNQFTLLDTDLNVVNYDEIDWNQVSAENFNYSIQQNPSSDNALGQVKFIFRNPYSIYLHDTPSKSLFDKDIRAFSHGCVRVEHPEELAAYLVEQLQPEYPDVRDLINRGIRREINLQNTIPVQIRYITCAGDDDGGLYCYKDIYGLDAREIEEFLLMASL